MATIKSYVKKAEDCIIGNDEIARIMSDSRDRGEPKHSKRPIRMPLGHDPAKEEQRADYRDDLTMDELRENDIEMTKDAIRNAKRYVFRTPRQAQAFVGQCVQMTLNHCGLMILEGMPAELVQRKMDENKVQVENRTKDPHGGSGPFYKGGDSWKNGLYIYKKGELVAFVSAPMIENDNPFALNKADVAKLEAFDRVMVDGKGAGLSKAIKGTIETTPARGLPFVITNAKISTKGFR